MLGALLHMFFFLEWSFIFGGRFTKDFRVVVMNIFGDFFVGQVQWDDREHVKAYGFAEYRRLCSL